MHINSKPIQLQHNVRIENGHIWQLHQYCVNGLQMEKKPQEILHHLALKKMQNYA